jgi:hypothetical protein
MSIVWNNNRKGRVNTLKPCCYISAIDNDDYDDDYNNNFEKIWNTKIELI